MSKIDELLIKANNRVEMLPTDIEAVKEVKQQLLQEVLKCFDEQEVYQDLNNKYDIEQALTELFK